MVQVKRSKRSAYWVIRNNGDLVYPYFDAEQKGIIRREFRNAIYEKSRGDMPLPRCFYGMGGVNCLSAGISSLLIGRQRSRF